MPDGTLSDAYRAFFEAYRTDLSQDFESTSDLAPASVVPVAQLGARGEHAGRDPRATALWRSSLPGHQRAGEGRRQPGAHRQHHALQQRPPARDHLAARGGVRLRFLRGSGAVAPSSEGARWSRRPHPRALGAAATHDAVRHPRRSLPGSPDRRGRRVGLLSAAHRAPHPAGSATKKRTGMPGTAASTRTRVSRR